MTIDSFRQFLLDNEWTCLSYDEDIIENSLFKDKRSMELYDDYAALYGSFEWKTPIVIYYENMKVLTASKLQDKSNEKVYIM